MKKNGRTAIAGLLGLAVLAAHSAVSASESVSPTIEEWSHNVWEAAEQGQRDLFNRQLDQLSSDAQDRHLIRIHESAQRLRENQDQAEEDRAETRREAERKMREHLDEDRVLKALNEALTAQAVSDDFDEIFQDDFVRELIDKADEYTAEAEERGDWLYARDLLFHLRTLYEDTDLHDEYDHYDRRLKRVTRRVALLAQYAPRRLHELRVEMAERMGDEPPGEFNEERAEAKEWEERLEGVDSRTLRQAIGMAASRHIEDAGWEPMLRGGLESIRLLVTTSDLKENFPALENRAFVDQWTRFLDDQLEDIEDAGRIRGRTMLSSMLSEMMRLNDRTFDLDDAILYREFGDGAMTSFDEMYDDPYTEIIWPDQMRRFRQATQGQFVGVGILIRYDERREIKVVTPLEGSPAYFAGVRPDDRIVEVNGRSTAGWSLNDAVDRITGEQGTEVTLGVRREDHDDLVEIPVTRDVIKMWSVRGWEKTGLSSDGKPEWEWYIDPESRIAYIRVSEFTEETANDLLAAWNTISEDRSNLPNGLILDLRFNPGGLLDAAVDVSRLFIDRGPIVSGEDKNQRRNFQYDANDGRASIGRHNIPTVVLVNKGSASASEIVAGAMQAHDAGIVIGERSHGKGSVQTVHQISMDSALKITTQYYRLPGGPNNPDGPLVHRRPGDTVWGVDPNLTVRMTPEQVSRSIEIRQESDIVHQDLFDGELDGIDFDEVDDEDRADINTLLTEGVDPQLETALLVLQARALAKLVPDAKHAHLGLE